MAELTIDLGTGEPRRTWCHRCLTTAAIEVDLYVLGPDRLIPVGTATRCDRCDDQDDQPTST